MLSVASTRTGPKSSAIITAPGEKCGLGFDERIRGSHHVYRKRGIPEKMNLQRDDGNAKPYQVRQFRRLALKYQMGSDE